MKFSRDKRHRFRVLGTDPKTKEPCTFWLNKAEHRRLIKFIQSPVTNCRRRHTVVPDKR